MATTRTTAQRGPTKRDQAQMIREARDMLIAAGYQAAHKGAPGFRIQPSSNLTQCFVTLDTANRDGIPIDMLAKANTPQAGRTLAERRAKHERVVSDYATILAPRFDSHLITPGGGLVLVAELCIWRRANAAPSAPEEGQGHAQG